MSIAHTQQQIVRIELPFEQALGKAARQNFDRAVRAGRALKNSWRSSRPEYINEARALLLRDGENKTPAAPDVEHIVLRAADK